MEFFCQEIYIIQIRINYHGEKKAIIEGIIKNEE